MSAADIAFECPCCGGPLITEVAHAGQKFDCPHCYREIEVPSGEAINKNQFQEPQGLRRVLREVRDREWENMRRELRTAKARNVELEAELETVRASTVPERDSEAGAGCDALKTQFTTLSEQFAEANEALAMSREKHGITLDALRAERERFREGAEAAEAAAAEVRRVMQDLEARLEVEHAKVFLMEAASGAGHMLPLISPGGSGSSREALEESAELSMGTLDSATRGGVQISQERPSVGPG